MNETNIDKKEADIDETNMEDKEPEIYEINIGDDEDQMLKFEEFVSKQEVDFFSPKMDISQFFICSNYLNIGKFVMFNLFMFE